MARGRVGKGSNRRRIQRRDEDSDESDEEYKVTDDEDFDESDECFSLDGDESEEILADFGKLQRVSRSRNTRRTFSGNKVNESMKPRKRRRISYTEDDNDDEVADEDDEEFMPWDREVYQANKPTEKKRISYTAYTEVDEEDDDSGGDDDEEEDDYKESAFSGRNRKQRNKPRSKKRVAYDEDDEEEEAAHEDDAELMSLDRETNEVNKPMEKERDLCTEVDDDYGEHYKELVFSGRSRKQRKKPREKKRVVYTDEEEEKEDADDDETELADEDNELEVADEDDAEFMSSARKANQIKTHMEMKRGSCKEADDDDDNDDDECDGEEEDDDLAELMSWDRKRNQRNKLGGKKVVYTEDDEDGEEDDDNDGDGEEDDDYAEFVLHRNRNQRKKPAGKKVAYTEDDEGGDEDDEFMNSGKKVTQKKNIREKRDVSYTEEEEADDDDSGFMCTSGKRNQINKRRQKRIVSYKEDTQEEEEEDENDAEFKLSESDFVDDEDETPKIKKNKAMRSHPQKKSVQGGQKKNKKVKAKNTTKPKQRNHRFGQKLGSSKDKSVTNKTIKENQSKISKRRKQRADWQRATVESDSDFVNSASSDHEYTISEEEREQMREARVYCANLRAKLRSSSYGNQERHPTYDQKKYPIRKGKEKIEDMKDDIGKQVCGICLSEEQKRTMRGVLNCCRHFFCFSCIMEWSKVESRCPLCKQRFTTITKAAKSDTGFDSRTVVIPVPECDQVYEPSEEELRGYLDPYESVICTECQSGGDDALMLLCDICDSPAHTFCVGLGREVPEGNWYCEGCRPTVFATLNSDRRLSNNAPEFSSSSIPGDFDLNELYVPETPLTQQTRVHPEPNPASGGTGATTLRERRRLHRQRHHLGFLNNNRMNDLVGRSSGTMASSSGIRLFGSQLDQARVSVSQNDHFFPPMHDPNNFYSRTDQFSVQVQNSSLASDGVALQDEHVALPEFKIEICTNSPV